MPLTFTYEGAAQEMLWEHMSDVSTTSFHNSTNLQDCQDFLILHIHIGEIIPVLYLAPHTPGGLGFGGLHLESTRIPQK